MATWIIHLRLAEIVLNEFDELDPHGFTVGSIAPDSGLPENNGENYNPPKEITHFLSPVEGNPWRKADLLFYERYLRSERNSSKERFSFIAGYFFHLVTDNLWDKWIALPVEKRFSKNFKNDTNFIWTVKHDWYGLDFMYLYANPDCFFYNTFLNCGYKPEYKLDFLIEEGLKKLISTIRGFYQEPYRREWAENRPGIYLTEPEMEVFVRDAAVYLKKIYKLTINDQINTKEDETVLDIYPPVREN